MNHVAFDPYVRRAAGVLDWRSLIGGLSAALLALCDVPLHAEAVKKRVRFCRADLFAVCEGNDGCIDDLLGYCKCKKVHKSPQRASDCCENEYLSDFRNSMRAIS